MHHDDPKGVSDLLPRMRISVQLFASTTPGVGSEEALLHLVLLTGQAEEHGFDTVWLAEHHRTPWNACPDPLVLAGFLLGRLRSISIGTAVVNLTVHNGLAVAERAVLLEQLETGRLQLGVGRGFAAADYELFGVDPASAGEAFNLQHSRFLAVSAEAAQGFPPTWLSTTGSPDSLELAARSGYGLLLASGPDRLHDIGERADQLWHHRGWTFPQRRAVFRVVHVADSIDLARAQIAPYLGWYLREAAKLQPQRPSSDLDELIRNFCIIGSAEHCADQIDKLRQSCSATELVCLFGLGGPYAQSSDAMRAFADGPMPLLRGV